VNPTKPYLLLEPGSDIATVDIIGGGVAAVVRVRVDRAQRTLTLKTHVSDREGSPSWEEHEHVINLPEWQGSEET
jgi:hypothetical protein